MPIFSRPSGTDLEIEFSHVLLSALSIVLSLASADAKTKAPVSRGFCSQFCAYVQATLRINLSRNSSGIRSCSTRAWAIATSAI